MTAGRYNTSGQAPLNRRSRRLAAMDDPARFIKSMASTLTAEDRERYRKMRVEALAADYVDRMLDPKEFRAAVERARKQAGE